MRKIMLDIASLLYNQRNILQNLKMTPPSINFMAEWFRELDEDSKQKEKGNSRN
jgi:hypothetical protein